MESESTDSVWEQILPQLDHAMKYLGPKDRDAIVLRFMKQMSLRDVGQTLGLSEEAARKRVQRGLEKLRLVLSRRGISTSTAALSATLSAKAVEVAPAVLRLSQRLRLWRQEPL